ncbi:MAG: 4-hydroxy-tetrahydrodipicolinate reductase [Candidatus Dormibacteraeota bacterium]|nr:4-hydroxy-tetrahydrodipicolinate reductase [Candidatus Dormibacteraeota bacterium]
MIRVGVAGFRGKVGVEMVRAVEAASDLEYVGGVEIGDDVGAFLVEAHPQALIDFTHPGSALAAGLLAVSHGCCPVVGTTGISADGITQLENACREAGIGGIVAPNFSVGAVLMVHLAEIAAPFFAAADVIEMHHQTKADAPSGTALATAKRIGARKAFDHFATEKMTLEGVRGGQVSSVGVHSVRLPGLVADQEVLFGLPGQTLSITHRTTSREAFVPGVLLALRSVTAQPTFFRALDEILGLAPNA